MSPLVQVPVAKLTALLSKKSGYVIVNNKLDLIDGHKVSAWCFRALWCNLRRYGRIPTGRSPRRCSVA